MKTKLIAPLTVIAAVVVALLVSFRPAPAGGAENVLVVANADSPVSCRIAQYYMSKRNIAKGYLVNVSCNDSSLSAGNETITLADYLEKIEGPVLEFLKSKKLEEKIQYIVLTKGIPIRITADAATGLNGQAVDSVLAVSGSVRPIVINIGKPDKPSIAAINKYWRSKERFSHTKFGGYLVTRLDGYTEADAKALVDRALGKHSSPIYVLFDGKSKASAEDVAKQPLSILNPDGSLDKAFKITYGDFDADMQRASQTISGRESVSMQLDTANEFMSSAKPLTVYVSWGSNAGTAYTAEIYHSLKFSPRSIVETAVSSSGRSFLPTTGGQSMIADLIAQGAAGAKGYVSEPYLHAMASPTVLVDLYTSGRNLAESYYAASRFIGWKDVVIGDPLCQLDVPKAGK